MKKLTTTQEKWFLRLVYVICIPIILIGALILGRGKLITSLGWLMMFEPKQSAKQFKLP